MGRTIASLALMSVLLSATAVCLADPLSDGRALYKAGQYAQAVGKLEQATREQPADARAWWQLNFAYNKLGRYADALNAVRKADELDPKHTFASEPGKYQETLSRLERSAAPRAGGRSSSGGTGRAAGNITQQLTTGDVYVERGMRVDVARLQAVARELQPTVVKFVVFNSTSDSRRLGRDADRIRRSLSDYVNRGQGYVIVASRAGIAVSSSSMSRNDMSEMARQVAPRMGAGDYTGGLQALARGLVRAHPARAVARTGVAAGGVPEAPRSNAGIIVLGILGFVAVLVIAMVAIGKIGARRRMRAMRGPIERLKGEVILQMGHLDDAISTLDPDTAARVREARTAAGTKLDEAARLLSRPSSERDLNRAQSLLDAAQADLDRGRAIANRAQSGQPVATGATASSPGAAPPVYPSAAEPGTDDGTDWSSVPESERGVCFFCSRPSRMSELTPVTVRLDEKPQKVLACAGDLETIRSGQVPQIRAFERDGRYVPWYADDRYDPYRDYYGRGYGTGSLLSDMVMLSMIDQMFWSWHRPMGWGWGGGWGNSYAFYPEHEMYRDHYSTQSASGSDSDVSAGGADFLQDVGGDGGAAGSDFASGDRS